MKRSLSEDARPWGTSRAERKGGGGEPYTRLLTAEDLAERWQVTVQWVYVKTRSGEIPRVPLPGRYYRYRLDVIERFEAGEGGNTDAGTSR